MADIEKERNLEAARDFLKISEEGRAELNRLFNPDYKKVGKLGKRATRVTEPLHQSEGDLSFDEIKIHFKKLNDELRQNTFSGPLVGHDLSSLNSFAKYLFEALGETESGKQIDQSVFSNEAAVERVIVGIDVFYAVLSRLEFQAQLELNMLEPVSELFKDDRVFLQQLDAPCRIMRVGPLGATDDPNRCVVTVNGKSEQKVERLLRLPYLPLPPALLSALGLNFFQNSFHPDKGAATKSVCDVSFDETKNETTIRYMDDGKGIKDEALKIEEDGRQAIFLPGKSFSGSSGLGLGDMDIILKAVVAEGFHVEIEASNEGLPSHFSGVDRGGCIEVRIRPEASAAGVQGSVANTLEPTPPQTSA